MYTKNQINYDQNNVFYRIIHKEMNANIILEDEKCIAFYDVAPKAKIHILVLPKIECADFEDFLTKAQDIRYFFDFIIEVVKKLNLTHYQLKTNKGSEAGQEIFHFHVHLLSEG